MKKDIDKICETCDCASDVKEADFDLFCKKWTDKDFQTIMEFFHCDITDIGVMKSEVFNNMQDLNNYKEEMEEYVDNDWCIDGSEKDDKEKFYDTIYTLLEENGIGNITDSVNLKEDGIENTHKAIYRMIKLFQSMGIDLSDLSDSNTMCLLVFLFKFARNENIRYKELFKPCLENLENISSKEKTRNGEIIKKLSIYLRLHCRPQIITGITMHMAVLYNLSLELIDALKAEVNRVCVISTKFNTVYEIIQKVCNIDGIDDNWLQSEPNLNIYEKFYLKLICYNVASVSADMIKVCDYILNMNFDRTTESEKYDSLFREIVNVEVIDKYAEKKNKEFNKILGINNRTFRAAEKLLKKYKEILIIGGMEKITGLHVLVMLEEITKNFKKEEGKEVSNQNRFYRHTTADKQKSFGAVLRSEEEPTFLLQEILKFRLDALCYAHLGAPHKYISFIWIIKKIYENESEFERCTKFVEMKYLCEELSHKYIEAIELIKNDKEDYIPFAIVQEIDSSHQQ